MRWPSIWASPMREEKSLSDMRLGYSRRGMFVTHTTKREDTDRVAKASNRSR